MPSVGFLMIWKTICANDWFPLPFDGCPSILMSLPFSFSYGLMLCHSVLVFIGHAMFPIQSSRRPMTILMVFLTSSHRNDAEYVIRWTLYPLGDNLSNWLVTLPFWNTYSLGLILFSSVLWVFIMSRFQCNLRNLYLSLTTMKRIFCKLRCQIAKFAPVRLTNNTRTADHLPSEVSAYMSACKSYLVRLTTVKSEFLQAEIAAWKNSSAT